MRRKVLLATMLALALSASVKWTPAGSAIRANSLLDILPDGNAAVLIDFQKIAGSSLWSTINAQEKLKSVLDRAQAEAADLGVKLDQMHKVALVFPNASLSNPTVALAGGFEQSELLARLRVSERISLTTEKYKGFDVHKVASKASTAVAKEPPENVSSSQAKPAGAVSVKKETSFVFVDSGTIVVGSPEAVRAAVDVKLGTRRGINQNIKLADALAQSPSAAVRFAIEITPAMASGLQSSQLPIPDFSSVKLVFGAIDVASGVDVNATLRSDSADHAKAIAERLNGLLVMAKGFLGAMSEAKAAPIAEALKSVNITSVDIDVKITGSLSVDLLNSLLSSQVRRT